LGQIPVPPVLSLVTGQVSYTDYNVRDILHRWVDQPQRLWDAIYQVMALGIETVIHVGPEPNIIPATFERLAENIRQQTQSSFGMRALSEIVRRPWLKGLFPQRASLLRAPLIEHIILEDWLLNQK
jgi:[acyl-carrier-protein] S-malonyltransferase